MGFIDSCEYIWESGVGFVYFFLYNFQYDQYRIEIIKLFFICFFEIMYLLLIGRKYYKSQIVFFDQYLYVLKKIIIKLVMFFVFDFWYYKYYVMVFVLIFNLFF